MKLNWTDLNLSSLKYFVDSVRLNSLTKSAEINFVSRPAISQAIRRLESQLGYALLEHKKKSFILTPPGHLFYLKAKEAIDLFNKKFDENSALANSFNLACSATLAEHIAMPYVQKLKLISNVDIRIGTTAKVRQLVLDGESSLGLLIDDEKTFGFDTAIIKKGEFEFQSKSGKFEYPLITTEHRPEVILGLQTIPKQIPHLQIESWTLCRKMAEILGGTCLVPDIFSKKFFKKVILKGFRYEYKVLAIAKNKNHLSKIERQLFEKNL